MDQAFDIALDATGNVHVTGQSFEPGGGSAYATIQYNASGVQQWAVRYHPGVGSDVAKALVVDATGNVYVTGISNLSDSDFGDDFATVKYNASGSQQWAARYDGPDQDIDQATAIALDATGNVYVTGFSDNVGELLTEPDYATVKYNANGGEVWVARYRGPANSTDIATGIAVDAAANVYITGLSYGIGTDVDYATIKYTQGLPACRKENKAMVCHHGKSLCIGAAAVMAHLKHGDQAGACSALPLTATNKGKLDIIDKHNDAAGRLRVFHYPNPVSTTVHIECELPFDGVVSVSLFDVVGRQVAVDAGGRKAGHYSTRFDVSGLQNGVYLYRVTLSAKNKLWVQTCKMSIIK